VATKAAGIVAVVRVEEGDTVVEGQVLAELVNDAEKASCEEARVACEEAAALEESAKKALEETAAQKAALEGSVAESAAALETARWALRQGEARLEEARRDYERKQALRETRDVGQAELDSAEAAWREAAALVEGAKSGIAEAESRASQSAANVTAALARWERLEADARAAAARGRGCASRLRQAEIRLEETVVRSPIAGRVTARKIHPGEAASPAGITTGTRGGALFTVADFSSLEAEVDVNESRLSELRPGHPVRLLVDAVPGNRYRGELRQVVPTADRQRAVVRVRVRLLDADARLLPDMAVRAMFLESEAAVSAEARGPEVPREAVVRDGGAAIVWVVERGRASRRQVETGGESGGRIAVTSGLSHGELVVIGNTEPLSEGLAVRVEER